MQKRISIVVAALLFSLSFPLGANARQLNADETAQILSRFTEATAAPINQNGILTGEDVADPDTFTGYSPLPTVDYTASDPENIAGRSMEKIEHSYGVARDGKPHSISVESQRYFNEHGCRAVTYDDKSEGKRLYLTFDCGYENGNTEKILDVLQEKKVPAAFFCTLYQVQSQPELTARMIRDGHIVGNHSDTHPDFSTLTGEEIAGQLENFDNHMRQKFGYCAPYFRFPEGAYSEYALAEVNSHGFTVAFWSLAYADWDENNQKGADYAYDTVMSRLHPGAVILLHSVSSDNAAAMARIIDGARAQGYEFYSLTDLPTA